MWGWIVSLGAWNWFIMAALLLLLEVIAPGMFMLWLGLTAIVVGRARERYDAAMADAIDPVRRVVDRAGAGVVAFRPQGGEGA